MLKLVRLKDTVLKDTVLKDTVLKDTVLKDTVQWTRDASETNSGVDTSRL